MKKLKLSLKVFIGCENQKVVGDFSRSSFSEWQGWKEGCRELKNN